MLAAGPEVKRHLTVWIPPTSAEPQPRGAAHRRHQQLSAPPAATPRPEVRPPQGLTGRRGKPRAPQARPSGDVVARPLTPAVPPPSPPAGSPRRGVSRRRWRGPSLWPHLAGKGRPALPGAPAGERAGGRRKARGGGRDPAPAFCFSPSGGQGAL